MQLDRRYTKPGTDPLDAVEYEKRRSVITNPDGSVVFEAKDVDVPRDWSQLATDIVVSKYFRRAGVPTPEGRESGVRQVVHRISHSIRRAGEQLGGYFASPADADAFEAELSHLLVTQNGAFNSPVWFNCGLFHEYGVTGSGGNWAWNFEKGDVETIENSYQRPQCSACFIQSVGDDLMSIFDLVKTEARIFKYGSGTGTNFSKLRSKHEKLSGGGTSSGLMSFLKVLDSGAGATKSGGTTRRAAKMVCLDMDHPEIVDFIDWKVREENKARILIESGEYPADFNGEAYHTVGGQNSNNSVRVSDEFMQAAAEGKEWGTYARTTGELINRYDAAELMDQISRAAWRCADPGVQFDTTINDWHTCPATDKINASNPCSEYMFLDDSACNLSSINLLKFLDEEGNFDIDGYRHAIRVFFLAQEILVDFSSYPTERIARNSHNYRPLGLGYANLGALLMQLGIPYDSPEGRAMCGALTAILTGHAYRVSAEMAETKGAFEGYARNAKPFMRVMKKHRAAVDHISAEFCPTYLLDAARLAWDEAIAHGEHHGFRNAQATVLAPTGTIGLLMDCDTTGIEPDFALVKFKKLAGGGYFKIVNQSVPHALRRLGYPSEEIQAILTYINGTMTLRGAPHINDVALKEKGFTDEALARIEASLRGVMDLNGAFNPRNLGDELLAKLGIAPSHAGERGFNVLASLGFTEAQIDEASDHICGRLTIEGAPQLSENHLPVFDCANRCGHKGGRFIAPMGHVRMMAAAQPFISGAISKTVNLPGEATVEEIRDIYTEAWKLGLKAIALYRDGCKMSQPLNVSSDDRKKKKAADPTVAAAKAPEAPAKSASEVFEQAYAEASRKGANTAPETVSIKLPAPLRRRLPQRRRGITQEARIGNHKVFVRTGEYADGTIGEIFIDMAKEGAAFRSMMSCFAIAVSKGLQYGVPLKEFVDTFTFTRFEPQGMCDHPNIKMATSVIDYVFRLLALEYLGDDSYCQVKPERLDEVISTTESAEEAANFGEAPATGQPPVEAGKPVRPSGDPRQSARIEAILPGVPAGVTAEARGPKAEGGAAPKGVGSALDRQLSKMMGDAPFCDNCGHLTVRNGTCYRCLNCGNSMGCS
jgi:ribonucleoside-diphosphate reductase alpha chain